SLSLKSKTCYINKPIKASNSHSTQTSNINKAPIPPSSLTLLLIRWNNQ
ncbi:hypothetical protein LINPERHAP2_LOCUS41332, partial [Linum perenne]